jgi:hypothetical protein
MIKTLIIKIMNMKKYITIRSFVMKFSLAIGMLFIFSCTDNFTEYNTDKSQMMAVGPKQLAGLFSRAQIQYCSWLSTDNYSRMSSTMANHFCGYVVCGIYNQEQNVMNTGWQNNGFNTIYSTVIPPLQSIFDVSRDGVNDDAYNVALIWKVCALHRVTDLWGPVPYSKAGSGEAVVPYESQKDVYYMMFEDLDNAITALTAALQKTPGLNVFGAGDMIYNGDVAKWIKLGNSLRLRLAIRLSNIDPAKAQAEAEAAIKGIMMETNADDALLAVNKWGSGGNGMPRMESFYQDVMSASMESLLKGYNDPRMQEFFSPVSPANITDAFPAELKTNANGYHGMANGSEPTHFSYFKSYSKYGPRFKDGNQLITPINIMNASETYFLKAEGAWRGWNMGGTAQSFYEKGIEISIKQWKGAAFSTTAINDYINGTTTPVAPENYPYNDPAMTDIPVKFSTDKTKQYEQIMTQKWLGLFPISFEAFAEYRRTRLPKIYTKKYSANANVSITAGQIVTRLPYPTGEKTSQPQEIEKAIVLLGGPDLETTTLWWDVNKNGN